jgi:membrane-associated phospholipid phosphatase
MGQSIDFRFARGVSLVTQTPLQAAILILIISVFCFELFPITEYILCTLLLAVVPILGIMIWNKANNRSGIDIEKKSDRQIPYVVALCSYIFCVLIMLLLEQRDQLFFISVSYLVSTMSMAAINLRWKISVHASGIALACSVYVCTFGLICVLSFLIVPLVIWSRVKLGKHSIYQLIFGALLGLIIPPILTLMI